MVTVTSIALVYSLNTYAGPRCYIYKAIATAMDYIMAILRSEEAPCGFAEEQARHSFSKLGALLDADTCMKAWTTVRLESIMFFHHTLSDRLGSFFDQLTYIFSFIFSQLQASISFLCRLVMLYFS